MNLLNVNRDKEDCLLFDTKNGKKRICHLYEKDGGINPDLYKDKPVIIWGCGNDGKKLYNKLKQLNGNILCFVDSNENLRNTMMFDNVPIISPNELSRYKEVILVLAFFRWTEVLDNIVEGLESIYADYIFHNTQNEKCITCGSINCMVNRAHFSPFLTERMFHKRIQTTKLVTCTECGVSFSSYRPIESEHANLYADYRGRDYIEQRKKYEPTYSVEEYDRSEEARRKDLYEFLKKELDVLSIKTILDWGGDRGQFIPSEFINAKKYVYDISEKELEAGVERVENISAIMHEKWDLILCLHVLEHVSNPKDILDKIVGLMSKGSYFYLEVPYEEYYQRYSDYEFSEHINFYNSRTLEMIGGIYGLETIKLNNTDTVLSALYRKW